MLLDRFVDSSLAYQGAGRGLGIEAIAELNDFATGSITPDLTLLLRLDPSRRARASSRGSSRPTASSRRSTAFFDDDRDGL